MVRLRSADRRHAGTVLPKRKRKSKRKIKSRKRIRRKSKSRSRTHSPGEVRRAHREITAALKGYIPAGVE